jgi:hypothetical protein
MPGVGDDGKLHVTGPPPGGGQRLYSGHPRVRAGFTALALELHQVMAAILCFEPWGDIVGPDEDQERDGTHRAHIGGETVRGLAGTDSERIGETSVQPHIPARSGGYRPMHPLWMEGHIAMHELATAGKPDTPMGAVFRPDSRDGRPSHH